MSDTLLEVGGNVLNLMVQVADLKAENARLRAALEEIATYCQCGGARGYVDDSRTPCHACIARKALQGEEVKS